MGGWRTGFGVAFARPWWREGKVKSGIGDSCTSDEDIASPLWRRWALQGYGGEAGRTRTTSVRQQGDSKRTTTRWADEEDGCKEGGNGKGSVTAREEDLKDDDELR